MKKKKIVSMGLAAMMAFSLIGCGGGNGGSSSTANTSSEDGLSGTIEVWYHDYSMESSLQGVIEAFNEKYPNIEVEYEIKADGDYDSLLKNAIQSGSGPDAFYTQGTATATMADLADNGVLEDLTNVVDFSFISDSAMERATLDGTVYAVPWMTLDTRTVFYNKDMFEENGWEVPKTFDEFESLLADIKSSGITPISMAYDPWSLLFMYEPLLSAVDPEYTKGLSDYSVDAAGQPAREALSKMVEYADAGYFGDNWTGVIDNSAQILAFTTGSAAMDVAGSWDAATIQENNPSLNLGAFSIPAKDGTTGLVGTSSNGFSVNADSPNLEAVNAFVNFCASKEAQTIWVQTNGSVSATDEIIPENEVAKEISESGSGNVYRSWQNVLSTYSKDGEAANIMTTDMPKVFDGSMTVDEFMDELEELMQ